MNTKLLSIFVLLLLTVLNTVAQTKLSTEEAVALKQQIIKTSKNTSSISNDFIQLKHLSFLSKDIESKGKLIFKSPNLIKWGYTAPFEYTVIFKENKLFVNDGGTKSDIDLSANKTFKELNSLIVKSVKGDMFDEEKFKITYYKKGKDYLVVFDTIDASLKSFIDVFELVFDAKTFNVLQIKMLESTEDYTTIKFVNQKINTPIANEVFTN